MNETENRKYRTINEIKSWFLEIINEIYKPSEAWPRKNDKLLQSRIIKGSFYYWHYNKK